MLDLAIAMFATALTLLVVTVGSFDRALELRRVEADRTS
jgi:hypothetical protein